MADEINGAAMAEPTMLYAPDGDELIWGIPCKTIIVDASAVDAHLAEGWHRSPLDFGVAVEPGAAVADAGSDPSVPLYTQEQLDAAVAQARSDQAAETLAEVEALRAKVGELEGLLADATAPKDEAPSFDLSPLDGSTETILAGLDGLSKDHLAALLAAETAGKTRKSVVAALEAALKA